MLPASLGALSLDAPPLFLDLLALPRMLARAIFLLILVDARLRCVEVSRAWRALLADTSFWDRIDLSITSGVTCFNLPLLRAAVAKAGGQLRALDVTGQRWDTRGRNILLGNARQHYVVPLAPLNHATARRLIREAAAESAATLAELRLDTGALYFADEVRALLEAAPALKVLELSFCINSDEHLTRALRSQPLHQALRRRRLFTSHALQSVDAFCKVMRRHASLEALRLAGTLLDDPLVMGALVHACIRLRTLELVGCDILPASLPVLTRLVAAGALRELVLDGTPRSPFDEAGEATQRFVAVVQASAMTKLQLIKIGPTAALPAPVTEVMALINARRA